MLCCEMKQNLSKENDDNIGEVQVERHSLNDGERSVLATGSFTHGEKVPVTPFHSSTKLRGTTTR